jgi:parallel beta-helix repeat protein
MMVEPLEGRQLLATLYVTTPFDNGDNNNPTLGSLRAAIVASNNAPVGTVTTIDFKIGTGAQTISLVAPLPTLANPTVIDGTTQPGYAGRPIIQVDGTQAGGGAIGFSLDDDSHNSTIQGLEITGFSGGGILDDNGNNNTFNNDVIGLHVVTGLPRVVANGTFGIEIRDQANNNTLSNLVVAGNTYNGVVINNSTGNTLTGSLIGTDASGTASLDRNGTALGNGVAGGGGSGVVVNGSASNTTISNNVIVNNQSFGVYITDSGTTKNTLVTNKIGVNKTGTAALGNGLDGVAVVSGASGNFIGKPGLGNVISGNGHSGVWISGFDNAGHTSQNTVAGNFIGTNAAGTAAIPNALDGVAVTNMAVSNTIGTTDAGGGNVISGNSEWGVYISDAGTNANVVQNDFIGTDVNGKAPVPNVFNGLDVVYGAQNNTIGGTTAAARNLISGNLHEGVLIGFAGTSGNVVEGNFIGTDVTGKAFLANSQQIDGVYVGLGAGSNTIGGQNPVGAFNTAAWNVISGNSASGILVTDSGTTGTVISGNFIGTDVTGTALLANGGNGITIAAGTSKTEVGSETSGIANLNIISGNLGDGVSITSSSGNNIAFNYIGVDLNNQNALPNRGNGVSIHAASGNRVNLDVIRSNGGFGILTDTGASHNAWYYDSMDGNASGAIAQPTNPSPQAVPVIANVVVGPTGLTTITGTITGSPYTNTGLTLQFYANPPATAPAAVQGLTFIGQATVTTDAKGNASFTATLPKALAGGEIITATADFNVSSTSNLSVPFTIAGTQTLGDAGFESPSVGSGTFGAFQYDPTGTVWTFAGNAGISGNGSGLTSANPNAPEGTQVGFLEKTGSFSQQVVLGAGNYQISFFAAQRANSQEDFQVLVDGKAVGTFAPSGSSYQTYTTTTFPLTTGTHTITFQGIDSAGGDNFAFVDAVTLAAVPPTVADAGFESPNVGSNNFNAFRYDPTGTPWTFTGGAGISGNGSGFTASNPSAPEGTQVAFLQGTGSFSQQVGGWAAGTYQISFSAAQRANVQASRQDFRVLVDGNVVGTFTPSGTSYQTYTTAPFTVTAGSHTVTFQGLDSAGGDNTAFIDAVSVAASPVGVDIVGQPTNTVLGQAIAPVTVLVVDQAGHRVPNSRVPVTISIYSGPAHAKLIGTTTVLAVNGVATFKGLQLSLVGSYRLEVTSPGLTPDISNVFTVTVKKG